MTNKDLIIHLIREGLRNLRLIFTLEDAGFDGSFYTMDISHVILEMAGFKERPDELYEWYFELIEKALAEITFWNLDEMLVKWSVAIWNAIQEKVENTNGSDSNYS